MKRLKTFALLTLAFLLLSILNTTAANVELDLNGIANNIIDGDTFDIRAINGTQYRIRLADVDAPERGEAGYAEAKENLNILVYGKTVYLDVDDLYTWDYRGTGTRLVCVSYVDYNASHLLNVNEALFRAGHVEKKDYDNEFSPYTWSLYISKEAVPELPSATIIAAVAIVVILTLVLLYRSRTRGSRIP